MYMYTYIYSYIYIYMNRRRAPARLEWSDGLVFCQPTGQ